MPYQVEYEQVVSFLATPEKGKEEEIRMLKIFKVAAQRIASVATVLNLRMQVSMPREEYGASAPPLFLIGDLGTPYVISILPVWRAQYAPGDSFRFYIPRTVQIGFKHTRGATVLSLVGQAGLTLETLVEVEGGRANNTTRYARIDWFDLMEPVEGTEWFPEIDRSRLLANPAVLYGMMEELRRS